ncbi:uncharacterized protein LOC127872721 isoform X1 [Dreissena polymorpha]|nr:uncharacterized protein LOC127872721 isoform X1 [Dreissena polymorpha]XP_052272034.1 uncharacterized protein LOC127872721 isoform X1 [Dreissena polymorpha]
MSAECTSTQDEQTLSGETQDENPANEITSNTDVNSSPISLGFVDYKDDQAENPPLVYGPANYHDQDVLLSYSNSDSQVYNKDTKDGNGIRGQCGLYNLGNTCFMNSGLQCLMSTAPMVKFLISYHGNEKTKDSTLLGEFRRLFGKIWSGQFSVVYPKEFKQILGIYHPQFQDYRQHDCQEFLALLLDSLHEQLNFKGQWTNQNTEAGPSCSKQPITYEHNINNKTCRRNVPQTVAKNQTCDKSRNANSRESTLTFDNMKGCKSPENSSSVSTLTFDNMKSPESSSSETPVEESSMNRPQVCKSKGIQNLISYTVNQISEDSNHSNLSEQSSDSDQCSVMKNLKLRSSPCEGLSNKIVNDCADKDCGVSSTDMDDVDMETEGEGTDNFGEEIVSFKRVSSLQDLRLSAKVKSLTKASSEQDLLWDSRVDSDCDIDKTGSASLNLQESVGKSTRSEQMEASFEPHVLNNAIPMVSVPSLVDLYSKETKTLNTNVLATEFISETVMNTDSEKFAKEDNTSRSEAMIEEDDILQSIAEVTTKTDGYETKRVKDINIRADKKTKFPKGACGGNSIPEKEECFSLSGVKRMKFEGTEKNLQMQEMCKLQKEALLCEAMRSDRPSTSRGNTGEESTFKKDTSPSLGSDIESELPDPEDADMDLSDVEDGPAVMSCDVSCDLEAAYTARDVVAAEEAWQKYLNRNDSVIVDTFQGQFKSTVVCGECSQVSVTFEPFMYLSVPVPRAMERQICIVFISPGVEPTQYLLVMHKQDKVSKVKQELCNVIGRNVDDIIIAEVLDWHVSRILEDNTMLRYINDSTRKLYAFEMDSISVTHNLDNLSCSQMGTSDPNDVFSHVETFTQSGNIKSERATSPDESVTSAYGYNNDNGDQSNYVSHSNNDLDIMGTGLWEWGQRSNTEKRRGSLETEPEDGWLGADSTTAVASSELDLTEVVSSAISGSSQSMEVGEKGVVSSSKGGEENDWKSCAICLEELPEMDLMVHTTCSGTFCSTCLEMSVQHYSESAFCCPVCSTPAEITEDFVPLASAANHKPKTRIIAVPISYRCETGLTEDTTPCLFAHPDVISLPSNLPWQHIRDCILARHPYLSEFRVMLTDGTGLKCSRCLYIEHCTGCEIPEQGEAILRPGDNLTVSVSRLPDDFTGVCRGLVNHPSMENKVSDDPVTLMDCFRAFTQSEDLDEHNPWFCPHCKQNQRAKKTMTVWQYPDTLIIQLKRFVFHELASTKVDCKVVFPIDDLDLNEFISGPKTKNLVYNLYSSVCHYGGANSGHYTAYARHPVDGRWYFYNDETVTESTPSDPEFSSTYMLFYQRKGTDKAIHIPEDLDLHIDTDDLHFDPVTSSDADTSVTFDPTGREVTPPGNASSPSHSSHSLAPSAGMFDMSIDVKVKGRDKNDSGSSDNVGRQQKTELAEADSTVGSFDFYS